MYRRAMTIEVGRFNKDGRLKVIKRHKEDSFFWKSDLTECLRFSDKKDEVEVLVMVDYWNENHHKDFERLWNLLMNVNSKKTKKTV